MKKFMKQYIADIWKCKYLILRLWIFFGVLSLFSDITTPIYIREIIVGGIMFLLVCVAILQKYVYDYWEEYDKKRISENEKDTN